MELFIRPYNERSFVVYGHDIASHHGSKLEALGGHFNERLRDGPGYIFSNIRLAEVESYVDSVIPTELRLYNRLVRLYMTAMEVIPDDRLRYFTVRGRYRHLTEETIAGPRELVATKVAGQLRIPLDVQFEDGAKRLTIVIHSDYSGD